MALSAAEYEEGGEWTEADYWEHYRLAGQEFKKHAAEMQAIFNAKIPKCVSVLNGDAGKRIVFPHVHPVAPLVRLTVCQHSAPPRHKLMVSCGDPADEANDYWQPCVYLYAFACPMPHTVPLTIEFRREPYCTRLHRGKNPQERDVS